MEGGGVEGEGGSAYMITNMNLNALYHKSHIQCSYAHFQEPLSRKIISHGSRFLWKGQTLYVRVSTKHIMQYISLPGLLIGRGQHVPKLQNSVWEQDSSEAQDFTTVGSPPGHLKPKINVKNDAEAVMPSGQLRQNRNTSLSCFKVIWWQLSQTLLHNFSC